jgi:predicted amidohydrolase YtcJ
MRFSKRLSLLLNCLPTPLASRTRATGFFAGATRFALLLVCVVAGVVPVRAKEPEPGPIARIFVGKIRTMDGSNRVAQAVAVDGRGMIAAVGTEPEVLAAAKAAGIAARLEVIRLEPGQTLLPGFLDAHLHISGPLLEHSGLAELVGPCRPDPYRAGDPPNCSNYIKTTLAELKKKVDKPGAGKSDAFVFGINLDPSRQPYDGTTSSETFTQSPAKFIEEDLTATRPVLIIDQSGHFGYANHAAFTVLRTEICGSKDPCPDWPPKLGPGGEWNTTSGCMPTGKDVSCYTGLLTEVPSYGPFVGAVGNSALNDLRSDPLKYVKGLGKGVAGALDDFRKAGLTTIISMAMSANEVKATRLLAELKDSGTRMVSIVPPEIAYEAPMNGKPIPPACNPTTDSHCRLPRDLGVSGIKVIVDGSTQGCTAAMQPPVLYRGNCAPPEGRINYDSWMDVRAELKKLWDTGLWRFEAHANGNRAMDMVLKVYASLQQAKPNMHTATVIHATVGDRKMWKRAQELREGKYVMDACDPDGKPVPKVDLRFTHLIGHVAYWGAVFEGQLGEENAANIDPTAFDQEYGIPFTLHSDATVSAPVPLWFVRQAVTRETWSYPLLESSHVLGPQHRISVLEALRAVTIRTAEEKELDRWLGSIEVGKVADFVVLSADPVLFESDPTKITDIKVVDTYLGGERTGPPGR